MNRREFLGAMAMGASLLKWPTARTQPAPLKIAFGSCLQQDRPQPVWKSISDLDPDLFVFLGDNIYADTDDMNVMAAKYRQLGENPDYRRFKEKTKIAAVWDDHDFGRNDAGSEYPFKEESKNHMLNFFDEPKNSARRTRPGNYDTIWIERGGARLQVILLDLRWFRSPLTYKEGTGYVPATDSESQLLGDGQWQWLESELQRPADVRLLCSSIQLASGEHCWEKWSNFPMDKRRLLQLLDDYQVNNLLAISGDMHYGELSSVVRPSGVPLYDLTSSGLNRFESAEGLVNSGRIHLYDRSPNFGFLEINLDGLPSVAASVYSEDGLVQFTSHLVLSPSLVSNL